MTPSFLTDQALLRLWERGRAASGVERGLLLLEAASPGLDEAGRLACSIAVRDAAVLGLRCRMAGPALAGLADCPHCGARLEFEVDGAALLASVPHAEPDPLCVGELRFRLPNSADLLASARNADAARAARELLRRCCLVGRGDDEWPDALVEEAERGLAERAGAADTRFLLACEDCGEAWQAPLDICAYAWEEIERHAQLLLDDVHRLALAYGWDERRILALGDARRAAYLARCDS